MGRQSAEGETGKLRAAADHLIDGRDTDQALADLAEEDAALGLIDAPVPTDLADGSGDVIVWRENAPAVDLFARVMTQWRMGPAGPVGLDYGVVLAMMRLYRVRERKSVMEDLQIMEARALERFREQAEQAKEKAS